MSSLLTSTFFLLSEASYILPHRRFLSMSRVRPVLHKAVPYCCFSATLFSPLLAFSATCRSLQICIDSSLLGAAVSPPVSALLEPSALLFGGFRLSPLTRFENFHETLTAECDMPCGSINYLSPSSLCSIWRNTLSISEFMTT